MSVFAFIEQRTQWNIYYDEVYIITEGFKVEQIMNAFIFKISSIA